MKCVSLPLPAMNQEGRLMGTLGATYPLVSAVLVKWGLIQKEKKSPDPMFPSSPTPNSHFPLSAHAINE